MDKKRAWIIFGILQIFVILALVASVFFSSSTLIVLIVVVFGCSTIALHRAIKLTIKVKPKAIKIIEKNYKFKLEDTESSLNFAGFKCRKYKFGEIYTKIVNENFFKVVIVKNASEYVNQQRANTKIKDNKEVSKCTKFIGFEIFLDMNDELKENLVNFSFQGDKVYYTTFYTFEDDLIETNYIKPIDQHKDNYDALIEYLDIKLRVQNEKH